MKKNIAIATVTAALFGVLLYLYGGHATPAGQKPLTVLSQTELQNLRADFNSSASQLRMLVLLSPT